MGKKKTKQKIKASRLGYCNICKQLKKLSEDHVPPRGCITPQPVEIRLFHEHLSHVVAPGRVNIHRVDGTILPGERENAKVSQNGVKFLSLCDTCNNTLLGGYYDPTFKKLSDTIGLFVRVRYQSGLALPQKMSVPIKTHRVARAAMGHILAAMPSKDFSKPPSFNNPFHDKMREYVLDPAAPLPHDVGIYYWTYPSMSQVIMHGLTVIELDNPQGYIHGDLLKFFPIAYWMVDKTMCTIEVNQSPLIKNRSGTIDDIEDVEIVFDDVPPTNWPETPNERFYTLMIGEASLVSQSRSHRRS